VIKQSFANANLQSLIECVVRDSFTMIRYKIPLNKSDTSTKQDIIHVKERRYVAKILTIVLRDFKEVLSGGKNKNSLKFMLEKVWHLCL